jgi:hypothetical protein
LRLCNKLVEPDGIEPLPAKLAKPATSSVHAPRGLGGAGRDRTPASEAGKTSDLVGSRAAWTWWSRTGSNRRPQACKASALPTELRPLIQAPQSPGARLRSLGSRCAYAPRALNAPVASSAFSKPRLRPNNKLVGPVRFELTTPRLSSVCSNQLSYEPVSPDHTTMPEPKDSSARGARSKGRDARTAAKRLTIEGRDH